MEDKKAFFGSGWYSLPDWIHEDLPSSKGLKGIYTDAKDGDLRLFLNKNERLILGVLFRRADSDGYSFPGLENIASGSSVHRNTVALNMDLLGKDGKHLVHIQKRHGQSNIYYLNMDMIRRWGWVYEVEMEARKQKKNPYSHSTTPEKPQYKGAKRPKRNPYSDSTTSGKKPQSDGTKKEGNPYSDSTTPPQSQYDTHTTTVHEVQHSKENTLSNGGKGSFEPEDPNNPSEEELEKLYSRARLLGVAGSLIKTYLKEGLTYLEISDILEDGGRGDKVIVKLQTLLGSLTVLKKNRKDI